jgi:hypothetical protein
LIEGLEQRVVAGRGGQAGRVEKVADLAPAAVDVAPAAALAAVVVIRRHPDRACPWQRAGGSGGFVGDAAELGQPGEPGIGGDPGLDGGLEPGALAGDGLADGAPCSLPGASLGGRDDARLPVPSWAIRVASRTSRARAVTSRSSASRSGSCG